MEDIINEIKIRKPSLNTSQHLRDIMSYYNEAAASKALTRYINEFHINQKLITALKEQREEQADNLISAQREIILLRQQLSLIRDTQQLLHRLMIGDSFSAAPGAGG